MTKKFFRTSLDLKSVAHSFRMLFCLFFIAASVTSANANDNNQKLDVYLAYTIRDKETMVQLKEALRHKDYRVKSSALDLLALADYSAKQKKTAKFNTAKVVVVVTSGDSSIYIDETRLNNAITTARYNPEIVEKIERYLRIYEQETP